MRLKSLTIHGFGPFDAATAKLYLDEIKGRVVAVCGDNGQGKSTLLELFPGALYRDCPTRGPLTKLATRRDAYVDVNIVNGQPYRITQKIDSHTNKSEAVVQDETGKPLLSSAKVREYDGWAEKNLPPPETMYAGPFAVQGRRGIIDMTAGERKAMLLRMIGIERYERLAAAARERAKTESGKLETLNARIKDETERGGDVEQIRRTIESSSAELESAQAATKAARTAYDKALESSKDAKKAEEVRAQRKQISARLNAANGEISDIETRIANNRKLIERGDEIRNAVTRTAEIDKELDRLRDERSRVEKKIAVLDSETAALQREFDDLTKRGRDAQHRKNDAAKLLERRDEIEKAVEGLSIIGEKIQTLETERDRLEARNRDIAGFLLDAKDERIGGLRDGLWEIANSPPIAKRKAEETLSADDELAKRTEEAPTEAAANKAKIVELSRELKSARQAREVTERIASDMPLLEQNAQAVETITQEIETISAKSESITEEIASKKRILEGLRTTDVKLLDAINEQNTERNKLDRLVLMADKLSQAEARIGDLNEALEQSRQRAAAAQRELDATPAIDAETVDIEQYSEAIEAAEAKLANTQDALSRAKQALEAAEASAQRIVELNTTRDALATGLADWTRLAHDLGRDGLQAVEIDAAVPELNEVANDLLRNTFGPRFTVEIATNRLAADGKRTLEGLEIRVIDTENGRDAPIETYSGGEVVIVGEAIALALTTISCRASGIERPTIVRDESGAALDRENGEAYIRMLRRAADLIDADKVLFVSHSDHLWGLADARIQISNGSIEVL